MDARVPRMAFPPCALRRVDSAARRMTRARPTHPAARRTAAAAMVFAAGLATAAAQGPLSLQEALVEARTANARLPAAGLRRVDGRGAARPGAGRTLAESRGRGRLSLCAGERLRPGADESGRRAPPGRRTAAAVRGRRPQGGRRTRRSGRRGRGRPIPDRGEGPRPRSAQPFCRAARGERRARRPARRDRTPFHVPDLAEEPTGGRPGSRGRRPENGRAARLRAGRRGRRRGAAGRIPPGAQREDGSRTRRPARARPARRRSSRPARPGTPRGRARRRSPPPRRRRARPRPTSPSPGPSGCPTCRSTPTSASGSRTRRT